MKRIAILGATGSIGRQTLDVVRQHRDRLSVTALTAHQSGSALAAAAAEFGVTKTALMDPAAAQEAGVPGGMEAIVELVTGDDVDCVVVAVAGVIGLVPTLAAIRAGKQIALASKEVLVAAGELVMPLVRKHGVTLTPIDSEHSAVFQCLQGMPDGGLDSVLLTASGGPFLGRKKEDLRGVTREEALNHPTWKMGGKITVDSATMMNKALETIEARWLFDLPMENVSVVVHPQSIVHSFVRFKDGSVLAQMGWPDMRLPIQYALLYPDRVESGLKPWDPVLTPDLTFRAPDAEAFPALTLARRAAAAGGTMPCAFNAANEECVAAFLDGACGFLAISEIVSAVMDRHAPQPVTLDALLDADKWARNQVRQLVRGIS